MTDPARSALFGEDAPDRFEPELPRSRAPLFEVLRRVFRHEVRGMEHIPERGPVLFVLNHGPFPVDAVLFCHALLRERGRWPRFLGERLIFEHPALERLLAPWGVIEGNHYQARRRFENGDFVGVFPGGSNEAWKPARERRQLRWAGRSGFARLAFKSNVPIVPVACPRGEDLFFVLNDGIAWGRKLLGTQKNLPLPLLLGLGLLPIPWKLVHHVGEPILPERRRGESVDDAVERLRATTEAAMLALLQR